MGSLAYDGVWALALALNRTMGMIERRDISETGCEEKGLEGALVPLHDFDYTNGLMGCVIRWSLEQTNFSGASVSAHRLTLFDFVLLSFELLHAGSYTV